MSGEGIQAKTMEKEQGEIIEEPLLGEVEKSEEKDKNLLTNANQRLGRSQVEEKIKEESCELPRDLKEKFKPLNCELCGVIVTSTITAYTHYEGKTHLKNVNAYMKKYHNVDNAFKKKKVDSQEYMCEVCNINLSSKVVYQQHKAGKQHQKNMRRDKPLSPKIKIEEDPTGRFGIGKSFLEKSDQPSSMESLLFCDICSTYTNTEKQMNFHEAGQKHKKKAEQLKRISTYSTNVKVSEGYYNEEDVWQASPIKKIRKNEIVTD